MNENERIKKEVISVLRQIYDPEIPVSVYDLGFIYDVAVENGNVKIAMTLTVPGCPLHQMITKQVEQGVRAIGGVKDVEVALTFDPPWTPDRITEEGKKLLRSYGYRI
ncbi:MAG: hypothetical protein B6D65_03270 [candidate division Zixibacteria bacterium 4484_93]|nr:MAG: hypothetical protein B6D65_03270 [candidate division Zixibacteria bacterium 4484_93]